MGSSLDLLTLAFVGDILGTSFAVNGAYNHLLDLEVPVNIFAGGRLDRRKRDIAAALGWGNKVSTCGGFDRGPGNAGKTNFVSCGRGPDNFWSRSRALHLLSHRGDGPVWC